MADPKLIHASLFIEVGKAAGAADVTFDNGAINAMLTIVDSVYHPKFDDNREIWAKRAGQLAAQICARAVDRDPRVPTEADVPRLASDPAARGPGAEVKDIPDIFEETPACAHP